MSNSTNDVSEQQALENYLRELELGKRFDGHDCDALDARFHPFRGHADCAACQSAVLVQRCGPGANEFEVANGQPGGFCENRAAHAATDIHCGACLSTNAPSKRRLCNDCRKAEFHAEAEANQIIVHARSARMALERYAERLKTEPDEARIRESIGDISASNDLLAEIMREFLPSIARAKGAA